MPNHVAQFYILHSTIYKVNSKYAKNMVYYDSTGPKLKAMVVRTASFGLGSTLWLTYDGNKSKQPLRGLNPSSCLLYTSDAADE